MTVGIGVLCENGKSVVVAADKMVTFGAPMNLITEPPALKKITQLNARCALIFSGSVPDGEEIVAAALQQAGNMGKSSIEKIAGIVKSAYVSLKKKRVEETILEPMLSADFGKFQTLVAQSPSSQILQQIVAMVMQHNMQLELIVAGTDDTGAHLFIASHPGQVAPADTMGFAAIGSGGLHAAIRVSLAQHTKAASLADGVYGVYEAKKAAEVAPGVGKLTDMAVIRDGKIRFADSQLFAMLESVRKERPTLTEEERKSLQKGCDEFFKPQAA
jgi:20S proteasome alpha/beta subunit